MNVSMSRICDITRGRDHVVRFTRPSGSVFAYCKRSKTGAGEGLGTRLGTPSVSFRFVSRFVLFLNLLAPLSTSTHHLGTHSQHAGSHEETLSNSAAQCCVRTAMNRPRVHWCAEIV